MSKPWEQEPVPEGFPKHLSQEQEAMVRIGGMRIVPMYVQLFGSTKKERAS